MSRLGAGLVLVAMTLALVATAGTSADGAPSQLVLYFASDGVPAGSMTGAQPPDIALPNIDPGRDSEPGLVLAKSGEGSQEMDPVKYQQWEYYAAGETLDLVRVVVWAALKDFEPGKTGRLGVYALDCAATCQVIGQGSAVVKGPSWKRTTVSLNAEHTFGAGHTLVIKVVVDSWSDDDLWLSYGTAQYPAHLFARVEAPPPTTTSTTTSTTTTTTSSTTSTSAPAQTTTTLPSSTTTTPGPSTTSSHPAGGSTPTTTIPDSTSNGYEPGSQLTTTLPAVNATDNDDDGDILVAIAADDGPPSEEGVAVPQGSTSLADLIASDLPAAVAISPQEGLLVAFSTVAQAFRTHLLPFLGLAFLGALMFVIGLSGDDDDEGEPAHSDMSRAGKWWFAG